MIDKMSINESVVIHFWLTVRKILDVSVHSDDRKPNENLKKFYEWSLANDRFPCWINWVKKLISPNYHWILAIFDMSIENRVWNWRAANPKSRKQSKRSNKKVLLLQFLLFLVWNGNCTLLYSCNKLNLKGT